MLFVYHIAKHHQALSDATNKRSFQMQQKGGDGPKPPPGVIPLPPCSPQKMTVESINVGCCFFCLCVVFVLASFHLNVVFLVVTHENIDVSQTQVITGRNFLVKDIYLMTSGNHFVDTLDNNIINDAAQIEIPKQVLDVLMTCSISNWTSEPYHQNLNQVERKIQDNQLLY